MKTNQLQCLRRLIQVITFCIFALSLTCTACAEANETVTYYIAKNGNNAWSGRLASPNSSLTDGPFATLVRARDAIREEKRRVKQETSAGGYTVLVREGVYYLKKPLVLGPQDSGTKGRPTTYAAYPGDNVELRGSKVVRGWKRHSGKIYKADLSNLNLGPNRFWQLFYKGRRQILARYPNLDPQRPRSGGFLYLTANLDAKTYVPLMGRPKAVHKTVSRTALEYNPKRLNPAKWSKPAQVRIHIWPWLNWNRNLLGVRTYDLNRHLLLLQNPASYPLTQGNRFFVDNAREELDIPGEWYFDPDLKQLFFWPPDGQSPKDNVTIPLLATLVKFSGDDRTKTFIRYVTLRGIVLSESADQLIRLSMAAHCKIAACRLKGSGGTAIEMTDRSHHNRIVGCDIDHTGGHGILLSGVRDWTHNLEGRLSNNIICNNHIRNIGELKTAIGIAIGPGCGGNVSHDNVICHNWVHDTPHQGITFNGFRNVVEYNHVHHTNQEYSDSGGIGMGSRDIYERGSIIRYNFIHDTGGYSMTSPGIWRYPYFTWGIYIDGHTSGVHVYGNLITRAPRGGIKIHGGQDNNIENNVIVNCGGQQIEFDPIDTIQMGSPGGRNRAHPDKTRWLMTGNKVIGNIFSYRDKRTFWLTARQPKWKQMFAESDRNLIWHHSKPVTFGLTSRKDSTGTLRQWQEMGFGSNSLVADPLFVDASNNDFRLQTESPAFKLGFIKIPIHRIGLFESPDRASWPVKIEDIQREKRLSRPEMGLYGRTRGWLRDKVVKVIE